MRQSGLDRWRVRGGLQVLLGLWLQLDCVSFSRESLVVTVFMYGSETMVSKEKERYRIRAVQMDNLRGLLGIKRMDKVRNTRI